MRDLSRHRGLEWQAAVCLILQAQRYDLARLEVLDWRTAVSLEGLFGKQIPKLRTALRGLGISQEELAQAVKTTANTISRWETATYKPSISDLERLPQFFGVPITIFFPKHNRSHGRMPS